MSLFRLGKAVVRSVLRSVQLLKEEPIKSSKVPWSVSNKKAVLVQHGHTDHLFKSPSSGLVGSYFKRCVSHGFASTQAKLGIELYDSFLKGHRVFRLLRKGEIHTSLFAFLGFVCVDIAAKPSLSQEEERDFNKLYQWMQNNIQHSLQAKVSSEYQSEDNHHGLKLSDYVIEHRLGEPSSNSAVYAARNAHDDKEYAVKMMFNFCTSSNSTAIEKAFAKEKKVLTMAPKQNEDSSYISMPPHPNVLPVLHSFVDIVPCLPDALDTYPAALPHKYTPKGMGRNKTMFLVTPRLDCTVDEYLKSHSLSTRTSNLLLLQLLEGVSHLVDNGVAQRDMKTENLLLDTSIAGCPRLVICDFGCALAERGIGLKMPFLTEETDRGGNIRLMPPEVITACCGQGVTIDYSKADGWSAGTIAYELFGNMNPFGRGGLDSACYQDDELPELTSAPVAVRWVVKKLLCRNMRDRLSARDASIILSVYLFAPSWWLRDEFLVTQGDILRWLVKQSIPTGITTDRDACWDVEAMSKMYFISRTSVQEISGAVARLRLLQS